jgi:lipopolysaccharide/colanic/teichoic acid biosynthesis glycosyltransferase
LRQPAQDEQFVGAHFFSFLHAALFGNFAAVLKRLFDILFAAAALLATSPLFFALWVLVRWRLGAPAFFRQERAGLGGRVFRIVKFRTMTDGRDAEGRLLPDVERLTPFGRFLRSTSADELPELWNILKGDMSVVGPRPLPSRYTARFSAEQRRRLEAPQGLTGWTAVNGRNALSWEDKFRLDVWYVEHRSLWLDCKIIALTLLNVARRKNISAAGEATAPEFVEKGGEGGAKAA